MCQHSSPPTPRSTDTAAAETACKSCGRRRKLWEIHTDYLCSVIGTCLSLDELRRLAGKTGLKHAKMSDYELHGRMISACADRSLASRAIHKHLDRKYAAAIRRLRGGQTTSSLRAAWKQAVASGRIAGGYWALMTHPHATSDVVYSAFGDIHMLSHLQGANRRVDLRQLSDAVAKAKAEQKRTATLQDELQQAHGELRRSTEHARAQDETIAQLRQELAMERERARASLVIRQRDAFRLEVEELHGLLQEQQRRADAAVQVSRELSRERQRVEHEVSALAEERDALAREASAAEAQITQLLSELQVSPECEECPVQSCLTGKRVLYVGGRTGLVRHYRELVERRGGDFIHHDGGLEEQKTHLDVLVRRAEVVLCPVDAVSHDACLRVKKACKRSARPFVPLRSSGVASLAAALHALNRP